MDMPEDIEITEEEDGSIVLDFDPMSALRGSGEFYENLAEDMDDTELGVIASDLLSEFEANKGHVQIGKKPTQKV